MNHRRDFRLLAGLLCVSLLIVFVRPAPADDKPEAARSQRASFFASLTMATAVEGWRRPSPLTKKPA